MIRLDFTRNIDTLALRRGVVIPAEGDPAPLIEKVRACRGIPSEIKLVVESSASFANTITLLESGVFDTVSLFKSTDESLNPLIEVICRTPALQSIDFVQISFEECACIARCGVSKRQISIRASALSDFVAASIIQKCNVQKVRMELHDSTNHTMDAARTNRTIDFLAIRHSGTHSIDAFERMLEGNTTLKRINVECATNANAIELIEAAGRTTNRTLVAIAIMSRALLSYAVGMSAAAERIMRASPFGPLIWTVPETKPYAKWVHYVDVGARIAQSVGRIVRDDGDFALVRTIRKFMISEYDRGFEELLQKRVALIR